MANPVPTLSNAAAGSNVDVAARVRDLIASGVPVVDIAVASGVTGRQVSNWARGANLPHGPNLDRLLELHYVAGYLAESYTPEGVRLWMHSRQRLLGDARPIDEMAEGRFDRVLALAIALAEGFPT